MLIKYLDGNPKSAHRVYALDTNLILLTISQRTPSVARCSGALQGMIVHHMENGEAAASPFTQHGPFRNVPKAVSAFQGMRFLSQALSGYRGRKNLSWIQKDFLGCTLYTSSGDEGPGYESRLFTHR